MARILVQLTAAACSVALVGTSAVCAEGAGQIHVKAVFAKSEYLFGEMIELTIQVENRGDGRLRLPISGGLVAGDDCPFSYAATSDARPERKDFTPLSRVGPLAEGNVLVLEPAAAITIAFNGLFVPVGKHQITIRYAHEPEYAATTDVDGLWRGEVESSPGNVAVRMPTPEEQRGLDENMRKLAQGLRRASSATRKRYAALMPRYLPASKAYVQLLLRDEDPVVRAQALVDIGRLENDRDGQSPGACMIDDIARMAKAEGNRWVKMRSAQVLSIAASADVGSRDVAVEVLELYLNGPDQEVRGFAANSLLHVAPKRAAQLISRQLRADPHPNPIFHNMLAQALSRKTGESDIYKALEMLAKDERQ